jgi:hypothetical protein
LTSTIIFQSYNYHYFYFISSFNLFSFNFEFGNSVLYYSTPTYYPFGYPSGLTQPAKKLPKRSEVSFYTAWG